jgi:hypothetical protein
MEQAAGPTWQTSAAHPERYHKVCYAAMLWVEHDQGRHVLEAMVSGAHLQTNNHPDVQRIMFICPDIMPGGEVVVFDAGAQVLRPLAYKCKVQEGCARSRETRVVKTTDHLQANSICAWSSTRPPWPCRTWTKYFGTRRRLQCAEAT